jgi:hypothetical protein
MVLRCMLSARKVRSSCSERAWACEHSDQNNSSFEPWLAEAVKVKYGRSMGKRRKTRERKSAGHLRRADLRDKIGTGGSASDS